MVTKFLVMDESLVAGLKTIEKYIDKFYDMQLKKCVYHLLFWNTQMFLNLNFNWTRLEILFQALLKHSFLERTVDPGLGGS